MEPEPRDYEEVELLVSLAHTSGTEQRRVLVVVELQGLVMYSSVADALRHAART